MTASFALCGPLFFSTLCFKNLAVGRRRRMLLGATWSQHDVEAANQTQQCRIASSKLWSPVTNKQAWAIGMVADRQDNLQACQIYRLHAFVWRLLLAMKGAKEDKCRSRHLRAVSLIAQTYKAGTGEAGNNWENTKQTGCWHDVLLEERMEKKLPRTGKNTVIHVQ